jgi:hypothetical protein
MNEQPSRRFVRSFLILSLFAATLSCVATEREMKPIPNSISPDGKYSLRAVKSIDPDNSLIAIEIVNNSNGHAIAETYPGYATYAMVDSDAYASALWSPDSRHLALGVRNGKRNFDTIVFAVKSDRATELDLPSAIDHTFKYLHLKDFFRFTNVKATRWIDNDTLVVKVTADASDSTDQNTIIFDADVTYQISTKRIIDLHIVSEKPEVG